MIDENLNKGAKAAKIVAELLTALLPGCDFILIIKPEKGQDCATVANIDPEDCLLMAQAFIDQKKEWIITTSDKTN